MRLHHLLSLAAALWIASPATGFAQDDDDDDGDDPAIMSYGLHGFWTGTGVGLGLGYLSTGSDFDSHEWRNLAMGAGIGAVSGIGVGLLLGTADHGSGDAPGAGYFIMRDMGYGTTLGGLGGGVVGALTLLGGGDSKNIPVGASIGALAGAGLGIIFGAIEGASDDADDDGDDDGDVEVEVESEASNVHFTLASVADSWVPVPAVRGTF
jgi:hypothetical protein